ncbi:MAG: YCF48-related protein [Chitinophagales bacterium]
MKRWISGLIMLALLTGCNKEALVGVASIATGTDATLYKITMVNDSIGFACGGEKYSKGVLLRTRNGGKSWLVDSVADKALYDLHFFRPEKGVIAGFDAFWAVTSDSGKTFSGGHQANYKPYRAISFLNEHSAVLAYGDGYSNGGWAISHDGGQQWQLDSDNQHACYACSYLSDSVILVAGYGTITRSINGGLQFAPVLEHGDIYVAMCFPNEHTGFAVGYNGAIEHTSNSGYSWDRQKSLNTAWGKQDHFYGIHFFDLNHGCAVGESGLMMVTDDGGHHWQRVKPFTDEDLRSVYMTSAQSGVVVGTHGKLFMFTF